MALGSNHLKTKGKLIMSRINIINFWFTFANEFRIAIL